MVYDLLRNDPECYKLFNYGIEGVSWELNDEGLRQQPEGYTDEKAGMVTNFWWGRNDDLEIRSAQTNWDAVTSFMMNMTASRLNILTDSSLQRLTISRLRSRTLTRSRPTT